MVVAKDKQTKSQVGGGGHENEKAIVTLGW